MERREPLTEQERERIYQAKLEGKTLATIAAEIGCSLSCARKWWRKGRDEGRKGLQNRSRGPTPRGPLSRFAPPVAEAALAWKRRHPRWGPDRVLAQLRTDPSLQGLPLPSRSRLAVFFRERCPECVAQRKPRPPQNPPPPRATGVHEVWQLDIQEGIRLEDGTIASIGNVRDPVGAAMVASRAFAVQTDRHWRKLRWTEVQQVLREGFTEWQTLPDSVMTDNELTLTGSPTDPFPSLLTLWLVGLGIRHRCIRPHQPTDQAQVERNHRTLSHFALDEESRANLQALQEALDRERWVHNAYFPSRASDCGGDRRWRPIRNSFALAVPTDRSGNGRSLTSSGSMTTWRRLPSDAG
ncbi:MAG: helix-turn-helix domain-containing protein [Anaerolineae bacterium]|nr:helix-turn-helix domain-containing protein [Anaerolineae bacterium]